MVKFYKLDFAPEGRSSLACLDKKIAQRILSKLKRLTQNIETIPHLPLKGNLSEFYKLRVGDWRIIYEINNDTETIIVHKIGHRKEIYK